MLFKSIPINHKKTQYVKRKSRFSFINTRLSSSPDNQTPTMSNASPPADWQIQNNRDVIRRLVNDGLETSQSKDEPGDLQYNYLPNDEPDDLQYYVQPNGGNELELLGRLVGMTPLRKFSLIGGSGNGSINPFFAGLSNNISITEINLYWLENGQAMRCYTSSSMFTIWLNEMVSNQRSAVLSAVMKNKMIRTLKLQPEVDTGKEWIDVLVNGLPNSNLLNLDISGINGSVKGVDALAAALPKSNLVSLNLGNINISESEVKALACALKADPRLEKLELVSDISIDGLVVIAEALVYNSHIKRVNLSNSVVTSECWMAFSNTLCDTSTVNKTCLSNHTLEDIRQVRLRLQEEEGFVPPPQDVVSALELNRCTDKQQVAINKILKHHRHFVIQPFVQWEFKVLPLLIRWLERAAPFSAEFDMNGTIEMRKLTVVYEFIQALPELFVSHVVRGLALRVAKVEQRLAMLKV